ncbi:sigma-54-dependent Fis family transcriptional regulator [Variovorax sp. J22P240]|uniref:sigma-54-dependent Fis family transcriptional regulator n=1 Tax=Variovorax sp. J22P240 TaxID=3053514 RepID=UPI002577AE17|nr:sigma-54-dependent Fis family transcriptional regulator [Variovorax sp. J22P240]MDL9997883.1 sigma-54-dependent Fis family transcriptional regulator [Variovorax sp. J22P240]
MALTLRKGEKPADPHADRVLDIVRGGLQDQTTDVVTSSWIRCLNEYNLRPDKPHGPNIIARGPLEERRARHAAVIECARYEMTTLYQQLADNEMAVLLTDTDGVILHMVSSPEFAAEVGPLGLRAGGIWSETEAGTNGMGTCLAAAGPVTVCRDDHFYTQFTQLTCSAVPVFDPTGNIVAALDVTSRSSLMQQHLLVLLSMTARMIENRLIDRQFRNAHPLHFHSRPEFVYTLHEGKLAVDDDGRILAANRSAMFQLGLQSMDQIRSRRIEDLFQTSLADMLQRSASSSFHPVVTYGTDAALRFFAVARRPASAADAMAVSLPSGDSSTAPIARAKARPAVLSAATADCTFEDPRLEEQLGIGRRVIARGTPVLVCGETGSGKEVFARALHDGSPRSAGPFVAINCASLPEALIESELFGYCAGAFTGAQRSGRRGKVLQADGGTLFLDEIADMPLELQSRLLRVLDERRVTPLGTEESHAVEFQLISASHRYLPTLVREGKFREDLYYRLAGIEVQLPPLRERSDRLALIRALLATEGGPDASLSPEAERLLMAHAWPGNIRQLRHALRTAAALADGKPITRVHLPAMAVNLQPASGIHGERVDSIAPASTSAAAPGTARDGQGDNAPGCAKLNLIQANERQLLLQMLEQHRWNVSNVAKALDVSRNTLYRKIHKLQIEVSHPEQES